MMNEGDTPEPELLDIDTPEDELWPMLVLLWSRDDPAHVGEVLMVSPELTRDRCFGRPTELENRQHLRVHLVRQCPDENLRAPPIIAPRLSREQLLISALRCSAQLRLRSIGRATVYVNGVEISEAIVGPGDLVRIGGDLLFLCCLRPPVLPSMRLETRWPSYPFGWSDDHHLVGESPQFWELRRQISDTARTLRSALIVGETGVGKSQVAHALHKLSARARSKFVTQTMAGMLDEQAALTLNGARRGYMVGSDSSLTGLIQCAHQGTLYLNEIGDLSPKIQAMLTRLVPMGEYTILGDVATRYADVATIASTSRPHDQLRPELLPRFDRVIHVPSLAQRPGDVPLVLAHLARQLAPKYPPQVAQLFHDGDINGYPRFARRFIEDTFLRTWPANIKHLGAALDQAMSYSLELEQHARGDGQIHNPPAVRPTPGRPDWQKLRLELFGPIEVPRIDLWLDHNCVFMPAAGDPRAKAIKVGSRTTLHQKVSVWLEKALQFTGNNVVSAECLLRGLPPGVRYRPFPELVTHIEKFRDTTRPPLHDQPPQGSMFSH